MQCIGVGEELLILFYIMTAMAPFLLMILMHVMIHAYEEVSSTQMPLILNTVFYQINTLGVETDNKSSNLSDFNEFHNLYSKEHSDTLSID